MAANAMMTQKLSINYTSEEDVAFEALQFQEPDLHVSCCFATIFFQHSPQMVEIEVPVGEYLLVVPRGFRLYDSGFPVKSNKLIIPAESLVSVNYELREEK